MLYYIQFKEVKILWGPGAEGRVPDNPNTRQEIWLENSKQFIYIFCIFSHPENSKMFNITSKYFSFFNNKPPGG